MTEATPQPWVSSVEHANGQVWCVVSRLAAVPGGKQRRVIHKTHRTDMAALTCANLTARGLNDEEGLP